MNYLSLDEIIFSPPISMIVAIAIIMAFISSGKKFGNWVFKYNSVFTIISGYILTILILSIIINGFISFAIDGKLIIRIVVFSIFINGCHDFYLFKNKLYNKFNDLIRYYKNLNLLDKIIFSIITFNVISLLLSSLGPPTDADSLDYHLGVPLSWLRNINEFPLDGWLHTRLVGLGEVINYIGLVCGTDILGQIIQYSGLWIVFLALCQLTSNKKQVLLIGLLVFCIPLNLSLITSQKPFVFPSAVMFFGFISFLRNIHNVNDKISFISLLFICYGIACKYSFIVPGFFLILFIMFISFKKHTLCKIYVALLLASLVTIVPIYFRNIFIYGDPISPMLEFLKSNPDPLIMRFADSIRTYGGTINLFNVAILPFKLGITFNPSLLSTVLGFGVLSIFFVKIKTYEAKIMYSIGGIISLSILLIGNISPRYYLDAYWLFIGAVSLNELNKRMLFFSKIMLIQGICFSILAFYGTISLFPGALSSQKRDFVMSKSANGYNESKWINSILPKDAFIITQIRSNALLPRKYVPWDQFFWGKKQEDVNTYLKSNDKKIDALLLKLPLHEDLSWLNENKIKSMKKTFYKGTRNPLNRGNKYEMQLFLLNSK